MNEDKDKALSSALFEGLKSDDFKDVIQNAAELGIDSILDKGVLRDVLIVSTILGITKTASNIRDLLLTKKILGFLNELNKVPLDERKKFFNDHLKYKKDRQKTGESILLLLERHEDLEKATILGKLFAAYIQNRLKHEKFYTLAYCIDRCTINDLKFLTEFFDRRVTFNLDIKKTFDIYRIKVKNLSRVIERLYFAGFAKLNLNTTEEEPNKYKEMGTEYEESVYDTTYSFLLSNNLLRFAEIMLGEFYDKGHKYDSIDIKTST